MIIYLIYNNFSNSVRTQPVCVCVCVCVGGGGGGVITHNMSLIQDYLNAVILI